MDEHTQLIAAEQADQQARWCDAASLADAPQMPHGAAFNAPAAGHTGLDSEFALLRLGQDAGNPPPRPPPATSCGGDTNPQIPGVCPTTTSMPRPSRPAMPSPPFSSEAWCWIDRT